MSQVRIKFNSDGFRQILVGDGVRSVVSDTTEGIASRAGDGFSSKTIMGGFGGGRWVGFAGSTDQASARAEAEDKVLSKAVTG